MNRMVVLAISLFVVLSACGSGDDSDGSAPTKTLTVSQAEKKTCTEVNAGIDEFNNGDYAATVTHFEKAKVTAKVLATISDEPEADALLDAVEYYANLDPADYPEAARTSDSFARNKAITLNQCAGEKEADPGQQT